MLSEILQLLHLSCTLLTLASEQDIGESLDAIFDTISNEYMRTLGE